MHWWHKGRRDADLNRELQSDLELEEEEQKERGLSPEEARYAALRALGNPTLIRDDTRDVWGWTMIENLLRDLRVGIRALFLSPGFSLMAVLVIALCIGAATSLFTVVQSTLLRPLPFSDPERLITLYEHFRDPGMNVQQFNYNAVSPGDYYDWRAQTHGFGDMAAWRWWRFSLTGDHGEVPEMLEAGGSSWNLFPLLGVHALIGRTFLQSEDRPNGDSVMLTWNFFARRFGGDSSILGRQIHLDGKPYTVVGVLPKWFTYPDAKVQVWVPYQTGLPPAILQHHDFHFSHVIARIRSDVSLARALSEVGAVQYRLHSENRNLPVAEDVAPITLTEDLAKGVKKPLLILFCAVACMLLIGCLNVANLLLARSAARQREISIRNALGAGRITLIRQQLVESLLISIAGGATGVLLSLTATKWLVDSWTNLPSAQSVRADAAVLAFACGIVFVTALLAGLLPAITSTGKKAVSVLQASSRGGAGSQTRTALRKTLLTVEIGATVVLLVASGLLLKSFWRLRTADTGCATDNVLTMSYSLPAQRYDSPEKANAFNETLLQQVRSMPGVLAVALGSQLPGAGAGEEDAFAISEHPSVSPGTPLPEALYRLADPGYFRALQIPLLSGHLFDNQDRIGYPKRVIVSRQLAQQYLPGEDPIGKHLRVPSRGNAEYEIIGVVADTLYQVGQPTRPTMYVSAFIGNSGEGLTVAIQTASDPLIFSIPVQKAISHLDPSLPVSDVLTLHQIIERSLGNASLSAGLVLAFAVLSLILACIGLYGVLSYVTTQRTGEIGLRIALGAERAQVLRLMLADGLRPALFGLLVGLGASVGMVRFIQSMLYGTRPLDPAVFAVVAACLLVVAALACLVPAWKASRIDPMQVLRIE